VSSCTHTESTYACYISRYKYQVCSQLLRPIKRICPKSSRQCDNLYHVVCVWSGVVLGGTQAQARGLNCIICLWLQESWTVQEIKVLDMILRGETIVLQWNAPMKMLCCKLWFHTYVFKRPRIYSTSITNSSRYMSGNVWTNTSNDDSRLCGAPNSWFPVGSSTSHEDDAETTEGSLCESGGRLTVF
jgi:hypothetical protein